MDWGMAKVVAQGLVRFLVKEYHHPMSTVKVHVDYLILTERGWEATGEILTEGFLLIFSEEGWDRELYGQLVCSGNSEWSIPMQRLDKFPAFVQNRVQEVTDFLLSL